MASEALSRRTDLWGLLAVLGAAFLWATMGVAGKWLYAAGGDPLTVVSWRVVIAAVALFIVLLIQAPHLVRLDLRRIPFFALYGLVVAANYACYFLALRHTTVAVAILLLYTNPAFTVIAARFLFDEPIDTRKALALLLTLAGVAMIAYGDKMSLALTSVGVLFGLGAGVTKAFYNLLGKRAGRDLSSWTIALYSFGLATIWMTFALGPRMGQAFAYTPTMWAGIVYLGLAPTLLGYGFFLWALQRIEVGRASLWATVEPPLAALLAFILLSEVPEPLQLVGSALIFLGVIVLQLRRQAGHNRELDVDDPNETR